MREERAEPKSVTIFRGDIGDNPGEDPEADVDSGTQ